VLVAEVAESDVTEARLEVEVNSLSLGREGLWLQPGITIRRLVLQSLFHVERSSAPVP